MSDVLLAKQVSLERCVRQAREYYALDRGLPFAEDRLRQDAIAMNLQRACELTIDFANYLVRRRKLGLPQDSRESFALLASAKLIGEPMARELQAMVGFRNVLVHEYRRVDLSVVVRIVEVRLDVLLAFAARAIELEPPTST